MRESRSRAKKKSLIKLLPEALLRQKSPRPPIFFESTVQLRHPWFTRALSETIRSAKLNTDEDLITLCENSCIDWHITRDYGLERQRIADGLGLDYNSSKISRYSVIGAVIKSGLEYRIKLAGLNTRERARERLAALNDNWRLILNERRDLDPLSEWRRPRFSIWMAKPKWNRHEFASLLLALEPEDFDEDFINRAVPYSVIGLRAQRLLRKIDDAVAGRELRFPNTVTNLRTWALENRETVPQQMLGRKTAKSSGSRRASVAHKQSILDAIQRTAKSHTLRITKERLLGLIEEVFGHGYLSGNSFNQEIWKKLPNTAKISGGKPDGKWLEEWPAAKRVFEQGLRQTILPPNPQI